MPRVINLLFNDFTHDNRVLKISRSLQKSGFGVFLAATHFDKNLPKEEEIEGFQVKRFNVGRFNILPLNLIFFWFLIIKNFKKEKLFHVNDLYVLPPAYVIKRFFNKSARIVYDCHEHETEAKIYIDKPLMKKWAVLFEKRMIRLADRVITVSQSIADDYVKMYGIETPNLVLNTPLYTKQKRYDLFREKLKISKEKVIFLFQGGYLPGRGIEKLIDVFSELSSKNKDLVLVFLVYGEGIDELKGKVKDIDNIFWHERVSPLEYMKYVSSADWGIYLMENICKNHNFALPNKIFDYILGGLPVVVSNLKEMSRLVNENVLGYTIDPDDKKGVLNLLNSIDMETKKKFVPNLEMVAKKYCWEEQEKVLINIYKSL
jgi:glycosyltransferase involved in cell wall biosynthesis